MKKGIIVLLITVLVAGFAFASTFTGNAKIEFGVNLEDESWGFKNSTYAKYAFEFELNTESAEKSEHSTDVWAEIAASAYAKIALDADNLKNGDVVTPGISGKVEISKANIHIGEDLTIGILGAGSSANFAKSYYANTATKKPYDTVSGKSIGSVGGFTVTYKEWNGGFGAKGSWATDPSTYEIWAHLETPAFKFAEDAVSVQAGVYADITDKDTTNASTFGGAAKAIYASEKVDADVEADLQYNVAAEQFLYEAAANAKLKFVANWPITINVYATPGAFFGYAGDYAKTLKLDAKVSTVGKVEFNEKSALDVTAYVDVRDIIVPALQLTVGATEAMTVDAFKFELGETATIKNLANEDLKVVTELALSAKVTYTHEKFTAYAEVKPTLLFDDVDTTETLKALGFECGISSDKIVENALLELTYKKADFAKNGDSVVNKGAVTASATIKF